MFLRSAACLHHRNGKYMKFHYFFYLLELQLPLRSQPVFVGLMMHRPSLSVVVCIIMSDNQK